MSERERWLELVEPETVAHFVATFVNRVDRYPVQLQDGRYTHVPEELREREVYAHLFHKITLGVYALSPTSQAKWLCVDADETDGLDQLKHLAMHLEADGQPCYLEQSRRGGHLWLFFSPRLGIDVRRIGNQLIQEVGLTTRIELYPRQAELRSGPGSLVRMPFGLHRVNGKVHHFIDVHDQPIAPTLREQIRILAQPQQVSSDYLNAVLQRAPQIEPLKQGTYVVGVVNHDVPPSVQIKQAVAVYDFVSSYVYLDGNGVGQCPFHDDQHASFQVNKQENYWNCYAGCGGGSIIDFWMKWREQQGLDSSFTPTVQELRDMLFITTKSKKKSHSKKPKR